MLRTSLRSVRAVAAGRQWQVARRPVLSAQRFYAADTKPEEPKTPPTVAAPSTVATNKSASPPPPPTTPPRRKKGFFRRLRNYILTITFLGALAFGGGVWYSRINDNFHDFFTEYVPYGEQAVLYLEELDFKKRFPDAAGRATGRRIDGEQVTIPAQSGASWRVADGSEISGRQSSSVQKTAAAKVAAQPKEVPAVTEAKKETAKLPATESKVEEKKKPSSSKKADKKKPAEKAEPKPVEPEKAVVVEKQAEKPAETAVVPAAAAAATPAWRPPEVDEPSRWPPASPIDPLAVPDAADPVVQDLVRMVNDIVTVINHDGASEKYGAAIGKAKAEISRVGSKIREIKEEAEREAARQVRQRVDEFDKAANELVSRLESALAAQEQAFRKEFEAELERLRLSYENKTKLVQERERRLAEERLGNQLLEQAVQLQRQFARDIQKHVEEEREARLGRLRELAATVEGLERLTAGWGEVVDANLRAQQLHVAVEAVRASLEDARHPRPFVRELVALKEIAAHDPVVDAAIASIPPSAYQRGVSTPAELIDRFRRVAAEVRKASLLPDDAGVASHASSYVLSKVLFRKQGLAAGDDVESILTRTQTLLEEGDLDNAAREMNTLTGWAKTLSRDWLAEVRRVLEVRQALEVIQTEARLQSLRLEQ
ncbi:hypothetical protein VTJ04DRAFT_1862 [Mycothermus thermophilus]|uniref:uncharacterized protein n=1 Tax=Humicola insolens TaxID=85995 RepID=UPI00374215BC